MNPQSYAMWQRLMAQLKQSAPAQFIGGARDMLLPEKLSDVVTGPAYAMRHPIESAKMLGGALQDASQSNFEKMFAAPSLVEKVGYGAAGAIPAIGPVAAMAGEEFGKGNTARGLGMSAALLGPSMYGGAKAGVRFGREAANEIMAARMELAKANAMPPPRVPLPDYAGTLPQKPLIGATPANLSSIIEKYGADTDRFAARTPSPAISHPPPPDAMMPALSPESAPAALPTRRDALKAGGAVAAAAMVPKLLAPAGEAAKAAGVVDVPVLGRAAPSALGREGFYRELKNRVQEGYEYGGELESPIVSDTNKLITNVRDGRMSEVPDLEAGVAPGDRFFLSRTEFDTPTGTAPKYVKQVNKVHSYENLRTALRDFNKHQRGEAAYDTYDPDSGANFGVKRVVHSEITPEAALRLNTIEKAKLPSSLYTTRGDPSVNRTISKAFESPDKFNFAVVNSSEDAFDSPYVVAVPKKFDIDRFIAKQNFGDTDNHRVIDVEEARAITHKNESTGGQVGERTRPDTVGISPRYTKRVSIRLLKDTMAKQIAENKRAAGQKKASPSLPPKLLAKLEDAPPSRRQFFKGLDWDDWTKDKK